MPQECEDPSSEAKPVPIFNVGARLPEQEYGLEKYVEGLYTRSVLHDCVKPF
jgi:hypothetical protein